MNSHLRPTERTAHALRIGFTSQLLSTNRKKPSFKANEEQNIKNVCGIPRLLRAALTLFVLGVDLNATAQEAPTPEQMAAMAERAAQLGLPKGVIQISPCVPTMGEHWANPEDMPLGPIYGVMGDEVVFVELMPAQADFAEGKSWHEVLVPPAGQPIHHVDFDYLPHGHEGYEVPHYDIHAYFVPHDEHMAFCPPDAASAEAGGGAGTPAYNRHITGPPLALAH